MLTNYSLINFLNKTLPSTEFAFKINNPGVKKLIGTIVIPEGFKI